MGHGGCGELEWIVERGRVVSGGCKSSVFVFVVARELTGRRRDGF